MSELQWHFIPYFIDNLVKLLYLCAYTVATRFTCFDDWWLFSIISIMFFYYWFIWFVYWKRNHTESAGYTLFFRFVFRIWIFDSLSNVNGLPAFWFGDGINIYVYFIRIRYRIDGSVCTWGTVAVLTLVLFSIITFFGLVH